MSSSPAPDAEALAWVHRGWDHLRLQRPLAAWAAWQRALRIKPGDPAATQALDLLAHADDLPAAARATYRFRPPRDDSARARWDAPLRDRPMDDLEVAAATFRAIAEADPADAPARYNEALCLAWLGENVAAIEALDRVVRLDAESFPEAAVEAWMLAEILRQGGGAEELADDLNHTLILPWSGAGDPAEWLASVAPLRSIDAPLLTSADDDASGFRTFEWLDRPIPELADCLTIFDLSEVLASVIAGPGALRFSSPGRQQIDLVESYLFEAIGDPAAKLDGRSSPLTLAMMDAEVFLFRLPGGLDETIGLQLSRDFVEWYFENLWVGGPRHALGNTLDDPHDAVTPRAAGDRIGTGSDAADVRAKLEAVIRLREQLAARPRFAGLYCGYPFDRLRRRVGLEPRDPATVDPADVTCMSKSELDRLDPAPLDGRTIAQAMTSAIMIGSQSAPRFAEAIITRGLTSLGEIPFNDLLLLMYHFQVEGNLEWAVACLDRAIEVDERMQGGRHRRRLEASRLNLESRRSTSEGYAEGDPVF